MCMTCNGLHHFIIFHFLSISQFYILLNDVVISECGFLFFFYEWVSDCDRNKKVIAPHLSLTRAGVKEEAITC